MILNADLLGDGSSDGEIDKENCEGRHQIAPGMIRAVIWHISYSEELQAINHPAPSYPQPGHTGIPAFGAHFHRGCGSSDGLGDLHLIEIPALSRPSNHLPSPPEVSMSVQVAG